MNLIEALQELKNGKKIRNKIWKEEFYIVYGKNGDLCNEKNELCNISLNLADSLVFDDDGWEVYKEVILDEVEKEYLSNIIKPFKDRVISIEMRQVFNNNYIVIALQNKFQKGYEESIVLPEFEKDTMYKNMEVNRKYKLKELDLL